MRVARVLVGVLVLLSTAVEASAAQWSVVASPNRSGVVNHLNATSCISGTFCMAVGGAPWGNVGAQPLAEKWNGSKISMLAVPVPTGVQESWLEGVSCLSTSFCMAVGRAYVPPSGGAASLIERWNGSTWSLSSEAGAPQDRLLHGVSCKSTTFCMAAGGVFNPSAGVDDPLIERWNGNSWTSTILANPENVDADLQGMSCAALNFCEAVGFGNIPLIERWNGSNWTMAYHAGSGALTGVRCKSSSFCMAVGSRSRQTLVMRWNGTLWTVISSPNPSSTDELVAVTCTSTTLCMAAGSQSSGSGTLVEAWNGTSWSVLATPRLSRTGALFGISCAGTGTTPFCLAVGTLGSKTLAEMY